MAMLSKKSPEGPAPSPSDLRESPVKVRRRPAVLAAGVVALVLSILVAVVVVNNLRDTTSVVVTNRDIAKGETISADDLQTRSINADAGIPVVTDPSTIIDKQAASAIPSGSIINPDQTTLQVLPPEDYTVVAVSLPFQRMPVTGLERGDRVRVVDTPRDQGEPPTQGPIATRGQVIDLAEHPDQGITVVDLLVPEEEGSWVAARAATNRVAIVKDSVNSAADVEAEESSSDSGASTDAESSAETEGGR